MPFFVVTDQVDTAALIHSVLSGRLGKAAREDAIEAIRAANPHIDLEHLRPGQVLVIPMVEGVTTKDVSSVPVDDVVGEVSTGLAALAGAADEAVTRSEHEVDEVKRVLDDGEIGERIKGSPELQAGLSAWSDTVEKDMTEAREAAERLRKNATAWEEELAELRALFRE